MSPALLVTASDCDGAERSTGKRAQQLTGFPRPPATHPTAKHSCVASPEHGRGVALPKKLPSG